MAAATGADCLSVWDFEQDPDGQTSVFLRNAIRQHGVLILQRNAVVTLELTLERSLMDRTLVIVMTLPHASGKIFEATLQVEGNTRSKHSLVFGEPKEMSWSFSKGSGQPVPLSDRQLQMPDEQKFSLALNAKSSEVTLRCGEKVLHTRTWVDPIVGIRKEEDVQIVLRSFSEEVRVHRVELWASALTETTTQSATPTAVGSDPFVSITAGSSSPVGPSEVNEGSNDPGNLTPTNSFSKAEWRYDVFISHAGTIKPLAIELENDLRRLGYKAFVDTNALHPGDDANKKMYQSARLAPVGLVLFNEDFLVRKFPLSELKIIVEAGTLVPVLVGMSHSQLEVAWQKSPEAMKLGTQFFERVTRTTFLVSSGTWRASLREEICFAVLRVFVEKVCPRLPDIASSMPHIDKAFAAAQVIAKHEVSFLGLKGMDYREAKSWETHLQNVKEERVPSGTALPN